MMNLISSAKLTKCSEDMNFSLETEGEKYVSVFKNKMGKKINFIERMHFSNNVTLGRVSSEPNAEI